MRRSLLRWAARGAKQASASAAAAPASTAAGRVKSAPSRAAATTAATPSCPNLSVRNTQRSITGFSLPLLRSRASIVLRALRLQDYALDVWLTNDSQMRQLNRQYRAQDRTTDVLSFPFQPLVPPSSDVPPEQRDLPPPCPLSGVRDLGQIVISAARVLKDAEELGQPLDDRMRLMLVHGTAHLLGYDHERPEDAALMEREERRLMDEIAKAEAEETEGSNKT